MTRRENLISKYDIKSDESYFSPEFETITYYFMADKSLIDECFPGKYPEATSTEISIEMPVSCKDVKSASVMVSPTLDCDGCETDYDWSDLGFSYVDFSYAEIEELLALAKEPVVIVELDCKASYNRYALTLQEFYEEFGPRLKEEMPAPSEQSTSYTLRPMVHMWYKLVEIGNSYWKKFFTDMKDGLPEGDIQNGNLAHIDFENLKSLKEAVIDTALRHQKVKILSFEKCLDLAYGKSIVQYQVGAEFVSFMFSKASKVDKCIESVKEEIIENLLQNAPMPLWSDLSKKLLDEIVESSFDMRFIEKDSEDWTQATANAILFEAENLGLSDVITEGKDWYITIFAAAMCCVNWFEHSTYGKPCLNEVLSISSCKATQSSEVLLDKLINMMLEEEGMNTRAVIKKLLEADFTKEDLLHLNFSADDVDNLVAEFEQYSRMEKHMQGEGIDPEDIKEAIGIIKDLRSHK